MLFKACAYRLAEQGYLVIAVGRGRPGRAEKVIHTLEGKTKGSNVADGVIPKHEFRPCDAFSLASVHQTAADIMSDHSAVDALVMSQGMATTQGFTPTAEGNDEKISLHYWSRMVMACTLLPALRKSTMSGGSVVLSILSGGVHSPYKNYQSDPELKINYSLLNAANIAGFYNDLGLDALSLRKDNRGVNFIHAGPGMVNTNWGTELPWYFKGIVRMFQPLGRSAKDCAEYMLSPTVFASANGEISLDRQVDGGVYIMNSNGKSGKLTNMHTKEARDFVWDVTAGVMKRSGFDVD